VKAILALVIPATVALTLGIVLIVAFGLGTNLLPLYALVPSSPAHTALIKISGGSGPLCSGGQYEPLNATDSGLVGVSLAPVSVTAEWFPGENSEACHSVLTHGGQAAATALAAAVDAEPKVLPGVYMCPADDGTSVSLYFSYAGTQVAEVVEVRLDGCLWIFDSGRTSRWWSGPAGVDASLAPALAALAPPMWRTYVHGSLHPVKAGP
jgi:hypothetical protein